MIQVIPIGAGAAFQRPAADARYRDGMASAPGVDAGTQKPGNGQLCTMLAVDIVGFTRNSRSDDIRRYLHERLFAYLEKAFDSSGIPWAGCLTEDRGDGALIVIPPQTPAGGLIGELPENLRRLVRAHNRLSAEAAGMQLRAAVHIGPAEHDGHGFAGSDINLLFRMLDARPLRHALAGSRAELVLMVSDDLYRSLADRASPGAFQPVRFQVRQTRGRAWIYLPGLPMLAGTASQDTERDIDRVMAAFKAALAHMDHSTREAARIRNLANVTDAQEAAEETRTPAALARHTLSQVGEASAASSRVASGWDSLFREARSPASIEQPASLAALAVVITPLAPGCLTDAEQPTGLAKLTIVTEPRAPGEPTDIEEPGQLAEWDIAVERLLPWDEL
jgi:hypothetical protein